MPTSQMHSYRASWLVLLIVPALTFSQADHSKAFWAKKYGEIGKMFAQRDMRAYKATLDPAFVCVDNAGKTHDRAEYIKMQCDPIVAASRVTDTVRVTSLNIHGGEVSVGYDWRYQIYTKGPRRTTKDIGRGVGTDTWHKVGRKWLTIKTVVKTSEDKTVRA